jgi:hypothetical protein
VSLERLQVFGRNLQTAYDIYSDPIGSAILNSTLACWGGGVTYESGSGDYAEWLERIDPEEKTTVGEVVAVRGGRISKNTDAARTTLEALTLQIRQVSRAQMGVAPAVTRRDR